MTPEELVTRVSVYCAQINQIEARVCAHLPAPDSTGVCLSGMIEGPICRKAKTLTTKFPLRPARSADAPGAQAVIVDPCFWTPELPMIYKVQLELTCRDQPPVVQQRMLGLRPFQQRGEHLFCAGRRWVLRAVDDQLCFAPDMPAAESTAAARDASLALVTDRVTPQLADEASHEGVLLIERCRENDPAAIAERLRTVAGWPAVAIVWIDAQIELPDDIGRAAPDLLLGYQVGPSQPPQAVPPWARLRFCDVRQLRSAGDRCDWPALPTVAVGSGQPYGTAADARAACEALQQSVAACGQFAGYIVRTPMDKLGSCEA